MIEVAVAGSDVEWGVAIDAFYVGEESNGDPGYLIEVAFPGSVV